MIEEEKNSNFNFKKFVTILLKILLTGLAFYILYTKVDLSKVKDLLLTLNPFYYILGVLAFLISKIISAIRLNAYYRTQALFISEIENTKIYYHAMFYNLIIPLIGGEASKILWIKNHYDISTKSLIWSALLDRGGGLVALIILTIILLYFSGIHFPYSQYSFLLIPLCLLGSYLLHHWFFKSYKKAWLKVNVLSTGVQIFQLFAAWCIILALHVEHAHLQYLFVFMLSSFAYMLPFIGARELAFVYGAEVVGLNEEISLSISLLFYTVIAINSILGGIFFIFPIKK